jgi:hypothetical protein
MLKEKKKNICSFFFLKITFSPVSLRFDAFILGGKKDLKTF